MPSFSATLEIIGINPFVFVPPALLKRIFLAAGKDKGAIPIRGMVNKKPYTQTLMKYRGHWRLYINTTMLKDAPKRIGEKIKVTVVYDPADRTVPMHPDLKAALQKNARARKVFETQTPSRQKEINRYLHALKSEESLKRNVKRAVDFLSGSGRFVGRDKP